MKEKLLPQWMIDATIVLYRSMCAGFGKRVPKPYYGNFCGPFWAVFFTYFVPLFAPFVLMATVVHLLFGKRRGERMGSAVVSASSQIVATKTRAGVSAAVLAGLVAIPIVLYWSVAWQVLVAAGAIIAIFATILGIGMALDWLDKNVRLDFINSFCDKVGGFWSALPKPVRWTLIGIGALIASPVILPIALSIGLIAGVGFLYHNYCPIVQESSPALP